MEETKKTPTLPLVKLDTKYKLVIPPFVEQKIRHLCNRVWEKEWSGTLFYKAEGSFEDGSLVITCADIFVMDIGTAGYTEFDMSPDVITYMTEHPELMECQMGLIHSHNNMSTFFSGTDTATLKEEGRDRNHFVSLIVNNAGSYTAAITRKVKSKRTVNETFSYESFEGVLVEATDSWEEEVEEIQYFHLDITKEGNVYSFPDVDARLAEIKKAKEAKAKTQPYTQGTLFPGRGSAGGNSKYQEGFSQTPKAVVQQPQLPFDAREIESEPPFEPADGVVPDQDVKADPKLIHSLCLQLLTGSVMIPNESKIDIKRWVNSMKSVIERRFGTGTEGLKMYQGFIESLVEFLVWNSEDPALTNMVDDDYMMTVIAADMFEYLGTLPQNTYTKICQSALLTYVS